MTTTPDLLQAVLAGDNLAQAWKRMRDDKGALGIDGVTIEDFPFHARVHWPGTSPVAEQHTRWSGSHRMLFREHANMSHET